MAWSPDPELEQMFLDELDERSGRLAAGAAAMASGAAESVDISRMRREGHTIKGTARVMGYEAVGRVAEMIEAIWDGIGSGTIEMSPALGEALAALSVELEISGRQNPATGTAALKSAAEAVGELVPEVEAADLPGASSDEEAVVDGDIQVSEGAVEPSATASGIVPQDEKQLPPAELDDDESIEDVELLAPTTVAPAPSRISSTVSESASRREPVGHGETLPVSTGHKLSSADSRWEPPNAPMEYGATIGAVEAWADESTVIVNAGRLYRLINRITATRANASTLTALATGASPGSEMGERAAEVVRAFDALQEDVLGLASLPLSTLTGTLPQLVNYLAKKLGKNVEFEISGDDGVVVDRKVLEAISEPVRQLVVNAVYHGLELPTRRKDQRKPGVGSLTLDVAIDGTMLELVVADDGSGVDWEVVHRVAVDQGRLHVDAPRTPKTLTDLLFEPGFTTGAIEGGKGDGLAKLAAAVEKLHGRVQFETWKDDGTRVTLRVPARQPLHRVLIVTSGGIRWAIPEAAVQQTMSTAAVGVDTFDGEQQMEWEGKPISLVALARATGAGPTGDESSIVVVNHRAGTAAVAVDSIDGSLDVAVTDIDLLAAATDLVTGAALLGGGAIALVLDAGALVGRTRLVPEGSRSHARVLVVDNSEAGRSVLSESLSASGFSTSVAGTAAEAVAALDDLDADGLVIDSSLPTASGIALVETVGRRDRRIPIVLISDSATEDDKMRAKKSGVDRFFEKANYRDGELANTLWELLGE